MPRRYGCLGPARGRVQTRNRFHATSFDVFQKITSDPDFAKVVDDGIARTYDATGLQAGKDYSFKVVGRNSLGEGAESDVSTKAA